MIKDDLGFVYDGIYSQDLSLFNAVIGVDLQEEPFLPSREINEVYIRGRDKPYFINISNSPLILNLQAAFTRPWDEPLIREIAKLFYVDYYKELYFVNDQDRVYFCMYAGDISMLHNNLKQGYINMELRCSDPYAYSQPKERVHTLSTATGTFEFINQGDISIKPNLTIKKTNAGNLTIKVNGEQTFELKNLVSQEEIFVDNENEIIKTSLSDRHRYDDHNDIFLEMKPGRSVIEVTGRSQLKWNWRFKKLQS